MANTAAPGWGADWLNAWLAAIGATVLVPGLRLGWTAGPAPTACFEIVDGDPAETIAAALPSQADLARLSIARTLPGSAELPRKVTLSAYWDRAAVARRAHDLFLGATLTDLQEPIKGDLPHSRFDPPVPRGITLYERLITCRQAIGTRAKELLAASLEGMVPRLAANGLGFDARRFPAGVQPGAEPMVDPIVECLAFFGLALFPIRGNGRATTRTRGWNDAREFEWVAWEPLLDGWGIDALLDQVASVGAGQRLPGWRGAALARLGVRAQYRSVAFLPVGKADSRRAFASRRVG